MAMDISWQTYRSLFLIFQNTISFDFERKTSYIASRVGGSICVRSWIERHNDACQASTVTCHEKEEKKNGQEKTWQKMKTRRKQTSALSGGDTARVNLCEPYHHPPTPHKKEKEKKMASSKIQAIHSRCRSIRRTAAWTLRWEDGRCGTGHTSFCYIFLICFLKHSQPQKI